MENYPELRSAIGKRLTSLVKEIPETMTGFSQMNNAANTPGALSVKTKELIAMAIAVAARCDGCLAFHGKALVEQEVTRQELLETLQVAIYMGGGPSLTYAAKAVEAYESFGGEKASG